MTRHSPLFIEEYRDFQLHWNTFIAHPEAWRVSVEFSHVDYDGPPDPRCGAAESVVAARREIDLWHEEQEDAQ